MHPARSRRPRAGTPRRGADESSRASTLSSGRRMEPVRFHRSISSTVRSALARQRFERLLARRLELVARLPRRHGGLIGDLETEIEEQAHVLDRAAQIPVVAQFIRRLVIVQVFVFLLLLPAPARRL